MRILVAAVLVLAAAPAFAQEPNRSAVVRGPAASSVLVPDDDRPAIGRGPIAGPAPTRDAGGPDIVRGMCQKGGCDEFSVVRIDRIRADEEGTLLRTRIRTYRASAQGRVEKGEDAGYVFCSPTKPTILAESGDKVAGFQIATAPTQESRETIRQQANFYAMYFTVCHGPEAGRAAVQNLEGTARQLGYRSPLARSVMVNLADPEEVFSRPSRQASRGVEPRPQRESRADDLLPPRAIPEAREPLPRRERWVERRPADEDDAIVIFRERRGPEARPWYREPERWIERVNPF
ncbi:MAG TPA: hypothetical protein VHL98_14450 [Microvirga sp.]|jgi:hypothetical protein|nr:hypothetical protein [Microvirga sp.]